MLDHDALGDRQNDPGGAIRQASSGTAPVLTLDRVTIHVRDDERRLKIVDDISFEIRPGEFFALVGESGSGKTMIARAAMRLLPDQIIDISGAITLCGTDVARAPESTMRKLRGSAVSMIFQEPMSSLNPLMTVEAQIGEAIDAHAPCPPEEKRRRILRFLSDVQFRDPERVASQFPHELSGGMRQRVMIAMALVNTPRLLIADEPTTALDVTIQREVIEILGRLAREYSLAILFISHDLSLVSQHAERIAVLYGGVMMELGPTRAVIDNPAHPYAAALLACVPGRRRAGQRQRGIEGSVPGVDNWGEGCRFASRCTRMREDCQRGTLALAWRDSRAVRCLYPLDANGAEGGQ